MILDLCHKIKRKWIKLRLQPIRVYCLHHVCATFDAESMNACDWMQIDDFKNKILSMRQSSVEFISLIDAYQHICNDWIRSKKYAVITLDDGYASIIEILPWLEELQIPATLFINGKYLDGKSYRENPNEKYLTKEELFALTSPLIEIGSHGWEHTSALDMTDMEFEKLVESDLKLLSVHPRYIPFHAYTWGKYKNANDIFLNERHIVPVLIDGETNYNDSLFIHRELIIHHT